MHYIVEFHGIFGERVLPILIVLAAIWLSVTWKADAAPTLPARIFPILVDIQFVLGLIYWVYGLAIGHGYYLSFPFILHPLLGLLAVLVAHGSVKPDGGFLLSRLGLGRLGRWSPLAALALLLLIVLGSILTSSSV